MTDEEFVELDRAHREISHSMRKGDIDLLVVAHERIAAMLENDAVRCISKERERIPQGELH